MKRLDRILLTLALIGAAGPALADPATMIIAGLTASGITVGTTAAFAIRIGVGLAFSALANAMQGSANANRAPQGIAIRSMTAGEQVPQSLIFGRYVTAGNLVAPEMTHGVDGDTRYLTRVVDLCDMRIEGVESLIIDGVACELATGSPATLTMTDGDGTTDAISNAYGPTVNKGDFIGFAWCKSYDGTQNAANGTLLNKYGSAPHRPWTADMIGTGVAYAMMTFLWRDSPQVWQGRPDVRFVVKGIRLYDPRKDSSEDGSGAHRYATQATHEWTENPVVMIYNLLRGIVLPSGDIYGGGFDYADLPYATWAAAMNACDVMIGERKTYIAGLEVFMGGGDVGGSSPADVIEELLRSCSGQIADVGGEIYIRVGAPGLPVKFITDDDVLVSQSQELDSFPGAEDSYNVVHATWMSPRNLWQAHEAYPRRDEDAITADGQELVANIALPAVTVPQQVQQLMVAWLNDAQRHRRQSITLPPDGILVKPLDVIDWTSERNGYIGKDFEVGQVGIDPTTLCTTLAMREVDPDDYDWSVGQDIAFTAPSIEPAIPPPLTVRDFNVTTDTIKDGAGVDRLPALRLTWAVPQPGVSSIRYQIKVSGTNTVAREGSTANVDIGYEVVSEGILPDVTYEARARPVGPRSTQWTNWLVATAPDVRIKEIDLDAEVQALLAEAEIVRQEGQQLVDDLRAEVVVGQAAGQQLVDDLRAEIDTEFAIEIPRVADVEQAIATIATQVTWLATLAAQTEKNVADAGLYIDPETGKAKLEAVAQVDEKINVVAVTLDAQAAEIALRTTQADVDLAIAAAQLDPAELPIITGLEGRVSDVEIVLSAAEAAIDLRATVVDFDALGTDVTEATVRIDALEAEIVQKVETASFTTLESRVTTAESTLSSLDGAGLLIEVSDIRQDLRLVDGLADMTLQQIADLHEEQLGRLADTAIVRQEYSALVTDERTARASLRSELVAVIDDNLATALQEIVVVASETEAQATLVTQLTATVNANAAAITNEAIARATADDALAGQFTTLSATVASNTAAISTEQAVRASADEALASSIITLEATVDLNTAAISTEQITRANADSALSVSINSVSATANSKNRTYRQTTAPTGAIAGDLWFDTSNQNKAYRFNGSTWVLTDNTQIAANTAAITSETIARANADEALAGQFTTLEATVAGNTAAISTEQAVRANADSALSTSITNLTSTVNANTAAISSEAATRANADSALSTTLSTVQAATNANTAAITTETAARTNADSALSTQINSVSATANATASTVSIQQSAIATLEGNAEASLVLRSRAGGASGEIEIVAADDPVSGPSSVVKIKSDRFQFIGDLAEFLGNVKITGDLIVDGAVSRRVYARGSSITTTTTAQQVVSKTFGVNSFVALQGGVGARTNPILLNLDMTFTIYSGGSGWEKMNIDAAVNIDGIWQSSFLVTETMIPLDAGFGRFQFTKAYVIDSGAWATVQAMRVRAWKSAAFATRVDVDADYLLTQISV